MASMPLTADEMKALRLMMREELQAQLRPFQDDVNRRFDGVATFMDEVNRRFDGVATFMDEVNRRFDRVMDEVNRRFDEIAKQIDGLYKRDETREQEYLFIR